MGFGIHAGADFPTIIKKKRLKVNVFLLKFRISPMGFGIHAGADFPTIINKKR
jgi:hypothetical protein